MDSFIREMEGQFPPKDSVYEYYVDVKTRTWVAWEDKLKGTWRYLSKSENTRVVPQRLFFNVYGCKSISCCLLYISSTYICLYHSHDLSLHTCMCAQMQVIRSGLLYLMQYAILQDLGTNCGHTALQLPGPQPDHPRSTRFTGRTCRNWKNQYCTGSPAETGSCTIQHSHHQSLGTGLHV
jgi:hypothetical protein